MKTNNYVSIIALGLLIMLSACQTTTSLPEETTSSNVEFSVAPNQVDCQGVGPQKCLVVNDEYFYNSIQGFDFEPGFEYELIVKKTLKQEPIPADASTFSYELVEVVSKNWVVPSNCSLYFDGCNTCTITDNKQEICTKKACGELEEPYCIEYSDKLPEGAVKCLDPRSQAVTREYAPVLASDGEEYANWRSACANQDVDWYYPFDHPNSVELRE